MMVQKKREQNRGNRRRVIGFSNSNKTDVSNKMLVLLLAIALIVTVVSTAISIGKISQLSGKIYDIVTGAPGFVMGETNITVNSVTSLRLSGGNGTLFNFGTGYVNGTCRGCGMTTDGASWNLFNNGSNTSQSATAACCTTFTPPASGFLIENDGNTNVSIGYTCSGNCTYVAFLGGTLGAGQSGQYANVLGGGSGLLIKVTANSVASQAGEESGTDTSQSCQGGGTLYRDTNWNLTNESAYSSCPTAHPSTPIFGNGNCTGTPAAIYAPLTRIGHWLCGNSSNFPLMADGTKDAGVIDINITVVDDTPAVGVRSSFRLTFNATSSG